MWDRAEIEKTLKHHLPKMRKVCFHILGDDYDTDEALRDAVANVLRKPRSKPDKPEAWLNKVALRAALDVNRKRKNRRRSEIPTEEVPEPRAPEDDPFRTLRVRRDVLQLVDRITAMVEDRRYEDVKLYFDVQLGRCTAQEQAQRLGLPARKLRSRHERASTAITRAARVVALVTDTGEEPNDCGKPLELSGQQKDSHLLVLAVEAHAKHCTKCASRLDDPEGMVGVFLTSVGVTLGGASLLVRLFETSKGTKIALASGAVAVAVTAAALMVPLTTPNAERASPAHRTTPTLPTKALPTATPSAVSPTPLAPDGTSPTTQTPQQSGPVQQTSPTTKSAVPSPGKAEPPPGETSAPPTPGGRMDRGPVVVGTQIDRRRVVVAETHPCCGEHEYAEVEVVVDAEAESVEIGFSGHRRSFTRALTGDLRGRVFKGRLGPFTDGSFRGQYTLVIRVVARDGSMTTTPFGGFEVVSCNRPG